MGISAVSTGKYKVYHILGKKIGCTKNIEKRVVQEQGFKSGEYEILFETDDIKEAAAAERQLQKDLGYKVDIKPYDKLFKKPMSKKVNVTDQTTTFAVSKDDIDGAFLGELEWETPYGNIKIDSTDKIEWILSNIKESMFNKSRSFVYNKAMHTAGPFQKHKEMSEIIDAPVYFCNPYHAWEKGGVENTNRLITQYIPKKSDISKISVKYIRKVEFKLQNRPRKCLRYKTPMEVMIENKPSLMSEDL